MARRHKRSVVFTTQVGEEVMAEPDEAGKRAGQRPGTSPSRPITVGTLVLDAAPSVTIDVYIHSRDGAGSDPPRGLAPDTVVRAGPVHVYDGEEDVVIQLARAATAGVVRVILPKNR
jgi:hypothetical protein